jgi:hypothetical protein
MLSAAAERLGCLRVSGQPYLLSVLVARPEEVVERTGESPIPMKPSEENMR